MMFSHPTSIETEKIPNVTSNILSCVKTRLLNMVEFNVQCLKVFCCHGNKSTILLFSSILQQLLKFLLNFTHICRIKGCGGAGGWLPPPIIFERLKLPQQIIYRRKENLSESPNHQKYWENILVSAIL